MEALISAIALVISTIMGLPARTAAASDAKKTRIGKALFQFVNALDIIITRGYAILDKVEAVALAQSDNEFQTAVGELRKLAIRQVESLEDAGSKLSQDLLSPNWYGRRDSEISDLLRRPTDVQKVLSIYEPDLGQSINVLFERKKNMLESFANFFNENVCLLDQNNLKIREFVFIQPGFLQEDLDDLCVMYYDENIIKAESRGLIKTHIVDLRVTSERQNYLQKAQKRLDELQSARQRLTELIKRYYEPHHLC